MCAEPWKRDTHTHTHTHTPENPRRKIAHSKDEKVELKSQSAMEYLMTYGWAILIIAIVLVAFFSLNLFNPYTFSPKASPGSCQILRPNGPGSNLFVSAVGPTCTTNEIPQFVAQLSTSNSPLITISRPASMPLGNIGAITYTAWINSGKPTEGIVTLGFSAGFEVAGNNTLFLHECSSGDTFIYNIHPLNVNQLQDSKWYFVALSYSQNANIIIGEIDNYSETAPPNGGPPTISNSGAIGWVMCNGGVPSESFAGQIANIQIYNTSLSASEMQSLYAEGIGGAPIDLQNLAGWWPLNGNANDYSGNGNNGVPTSVIFTSSWENGYSAP